MTPLSTQNFKALGWRWCHFLICWLLSHSCWSPSVSPSDSPNKWYYSRWFTAWASTV